MKKIQFKILLKGHSIITISIHEFFHALMAFILNVKIGDYEVNGYYKEKSGNYEIKGNVTTYSNNHFKHLLVNLAPIIFTLLIMHICIYFDNFIMYMYLVCNLIFGNLWISEGDWINAKSNWKNIFNKSNILKPIYNMFKK